MTTRIQPPPTNRLSRGSREPLLRAALHLDADSPPPKIAAWKAWAFAGWVLVAAGAYLLSMLRSL